MKSFIGVEGIFLKEKRVPTSMILSFHICGWTQICCYCGAICLCLLSSYNVLLSILGMMCGWFSLHFVYTDS